jgi:hypothetical protein
MSHPSRGVLWVTWGDRSAVVDAVDRSRESMGRVHPDVPQQHKHLAWGSLLDKARMDDWRFADSQLYLDADTVVLGDLSYGFELAERHGLACRICECPWARRYGDEQLAGDMIEYNTGVLFWTAEAHPIMRTWEWLAPRTDSSCRYMDSRVSHEATMQMNDQASFALAICKTGVNPCALSPNWNFRPRWDSTWWGPVRVWHDYAPPPKDIVAWSQAQDAPGAIIQCARASG